MNIAIMVVIVMTIIGLVFGLILAFANKIFSIEVNPLIHLVEDILPKGQCGGCGYAGCAAYAEAVVMNADVPPNLCIPGKKVVADLVANLTGKSAPEIAPRIAQLRCKGTLSKAARKYNYVGVQDCIAASLVQGGPKECQYGCMGLGTCVKSCNFGALSMGEEGLPIVDEKKCVGCGKCEKVCPILAISMLKNKESKAAAQVDNEVCLGCGVCVRSCPQNAIELVRREVQVITPVNSTHRFVLQTIEKGTLQNLIFDNQAFANHRAMAAVLGVILKLPPLKQIMASKQFKSIYLDKLLSKKIEER